MSTPAPSPYEADPALWKPLVALEGPSGCGKSTLIPLVRDLLVEMGIRASVEANNAVSGLGDDIRRLAGDPGGALSLAYLTAAARALMRQRRTDADVVLADRFALSSFVYQGFAGIPVETLHRLNAPLMAGATTVLLEVGEGEVRIRREGRPAAGTDWYKRNLPLGEELRRYDEAARWVAGQGHPVRRVAAGGSPGDVAARVAVIIAELARGGPV